MISRFGSLEEFLKALKETKFDHIGIPFSWTFGGKVQVIRDKSGNREFLEILNMQYPIVGNIPEQRLWIITTII